MSRFSSTKNNILPRKDSYMIIYFLPIREHRLSEEDASDFLLWFQSRLEAIENNFEEKRLKNDGTELSFEEFLSICVRQRCKNFLAERKKKEYVRNVTDQFYCCDNCQSASSSCSCDKDSLAGLYYSKTHARRSRLTTMILMFAPFIEYPEAAHMAEVCKLDVQQFIPMYESVRNIYDKTYGERIRKASLKRNISSLKAIIDGVGAAEESRRQSRRSGKGILRSNRFDNVVPLKVVSSVQHIPYNTALSNLRIIRKEAVILSKSKKL